MRSARHSPNPPRRAKQILDLPCRGAKPCLAAAVRKLVPVVALLIVGWSAGLAEPLAEAARAQVGVTITYDPAYVSLAYPGGDLAPERGVCSDVVIRAFRKAHRLDLQQLVHEDMSAHFGTYPKLWGLSKTDRNIDHRRVPTCKRISPARGGRFPSAGNPAIFRPATWSPARCRQTCRT